MKKHLFAAAVAVSCSGMIVSAQATSSSPAQPQSQSQTASPTAGTTAGSTAGTTAGAQATTTFTGCVYQEKDVPGRAPNVAERVGILEDYILAEVRPASAAGTTAASGASGAVGTSGTTASGSASAMYKLEFADDEKLKAMVGKRVEVTGRIDAEAGDNTPRAGATTPETSKTDRVIGRDKVDLPEFELTSIREVSGTCPATPSAK